MYSLQPAYRVHRDPPRTVALLTNGTRMAIVGVGAVLLLAFGGGVGQLTAYAAIAGFALIGPREAVQALALSWLLTFLNPGIFDTHEAAPLMRWLVTLTAFGSVALRSVRPSMRLSPPLIGVSLFVIVGVALTPIASYAVDVSLFKLLSFFLVAFSLVVGLDLTRGDTPFWRSWLFAFTSTIILVSIPFVGSNLGFTRNGSGFQGILNHPQAYGAFLGPALAYLVFFRHASHNMRPGSVALLGIGLISLYLTEARVGVLALAVGLTFSLAWWAVDWLRKRRPNLSVKTIAFFLVVSSALVPVALLSGNDFRDGFEQLVWKRSSATTLAEAFDASRGFLVERSLDNFRLSPLFGIGFGLPSDPSSLNVSRDPILGLPIGAPIEKGVTVIAVFEELGIIGFLFFALMVALVLKPVFGASKSLATMGLATASLAVTVGEHILFATGGMGLVTWLFLGLAGVVGRPPTEPTQ